jgi:hypothetical protein
MKKFIVVGLIALGLVACGSKEEVATPAPEVPEVVCVPFDGNTENLVDGEWYTFDTENGVVSVCSKKEEAAPVAETATEEVPAEGVSATATATEVPVAQ